MPQPGHSWGSSVGDKEVAATRWDTHPRRCSAPRPLREGAKDNNVQLHPAVHISGFLLPFKQTAHRAGDGLTAGTGSLCVLPQAPRRARRVAPCAEARAEADVPSFSRTATSGTPFNFFTLVNLELGYFSCLNKEHKTDASLEASVRTSLGAESNISFCPYWIKQGRRSTLSYLTPSPISRASA